MNRIRILITTIVLLCFLALPATATEAAPALSQKTLTLNKGEFHKLELKGASGYLRWSSGNPSVATVTPAGYVTGVGAGTTNISVSYLNQNYNCKVTIEQPKLNVSSKLTILKGESKQLKVTGTRKKVSWSISSGKEFISINRKGVLRAKSKIGTGVVRAQIGDQSLWIHVNVAITRLNPKTGEYYLIERKCKRYTVGTITTYVDRSISSRQRAVWFSTLKSTSAGLSRRVTTAYYLSPSLFSDISNVLLSSNGNEAKGIAGRAYGRKIYVKQTSSAAWLKHVVTHEAGHVRYNTFNEAQRQRWNEIYAKELKPIGKWRKLGANESFAELTACNHTGKMVSGGLTGKFIAAATKK